MSPLRLLLLLALAASVHAAPEFSPQPAVLHQQRDGLGNFIAKLEKGGPVKIAYLGGSITAASGWRVKTRDWFAKQYPQAQVEEIHAAIGGTGSNLGVYRVQKDALQFDPDLLFVEFSVNDGGAKPDDIWRGMEGIVRQTWADNPRCDICFVYTFRVNYETDLREGRCPSAPSADEMLAAHYGIPSINMAADPEGRIVFSNDGVHPVEAGHEIYTDVIADAMRTWKDSSKPLDHTSKLATSFIDDHWQAAKIVGVSPDMLKGSWKKLPGDSGLGKSFEKRLGVIWEASTPGDTLRFKFKGSSAALYDLLGPDGGQVTITVDGVKRGKPVPRFDSYCTYHRLSTLKLADNLDPNQEHEIVVEIHPDQPDRQPVAFRLKDPEKELKEPKFQGTNLRVGGILLMGELMID